MRVLAVVLAVGGAFAWWLFAHPLCSCSSKTTTYMAAVQSDLRQLITAQEIHYADHERYATRMEDLAEGFVTSAGVTVALANANDAAWSAIAFHREVSGWCAVYVGDVPAPVPGMEEGEPACRWSPDGDAATRGLRRPEDGR